MEVKRGAMTAKVEGADVEAALQNIFFSDAESFQVVKAMANPVINQMQANAPVNEGRVKRSIRMFRSKKKPYSQVQIGPKYVKGGGPDAGNAAHLTEFGTDDREMKTGLKYGSLTKNLEPFKGPPQFAPYKGKKLGRVESKQWILLTYNQVAESTWDLGANMITDKIDKKAKQQGLQTK